MRRNWIKLYVDQCLRGTMITELSAAERWIWVGLLLMAGDSNEEGLIFLRKNEKGGLMGYSESTISELLGVSVSDFHSATTKMIKYEKIKIDKNKVIEILNWGKYQSEYQRQKKYRDEWEKDPDYLRKQKEWQLKGQKARHLCFDNYETICVKCEGRDNLHAHHVDRNRENNNIDNLMFLCESCHSPIHTNDEKEYLKEMEELKKKRESYKLNCNSASHKSNSLDIDRDKDRDKDKEKDNTLCEKEFQKLWEAWPKEGRFDSKHCLMKFKALNKQGKLELFKKVSNGYLQFLRHQKDHENFPQKAKHLKTWMNNWEGERESYENFKYEPRL